MTTTLSTCLACCHRHRAAKTASSSSTSSSPHLSSQVLAARHFRTRKSDSVFSRRVVRATPPAEEDLSAKEILEQVKEKKNNNNNRRQADSTDFMATFLTRRFGLKGGLAWLGLLTFGVVSEQLKTRRETREEKENTKAVAEEKRITVKMNESTSYEELVKGGGEYVQQGFLCGANVTVRDLDANETVFDTRKTNRPIGFVYSKPRPPPVLPYDVNESFSDERYVMRNGSRRVFTTTSGEDGLTFKDGSYVKPNANVEIDFEFTKVSIPPS
ncbi:unnamed protein product [Bathycoccus prasinos]